MSSLLPALETEPARTAVRFGDQTLDYAALSAAARHLALSIGGRAGRVAVWATPTAQTAVSVVAGLLAGVPVVPLNPRSGERELAHIVADSTPGLVLAAEGDELPEPLAGLPRIDTPLRVPEEETAGRRVPLQPSATAGPALIVYTSGTTGAPKGVVLSQRALAATLDDLAAVWEWTADDVLVHALPLFHVHGLVLGLVGPLRRGGTLHHLGAFSTEGVTTALAGGGTMLFGVPTMYHRVARALDEEPELVAALRGARLLVSGSAALPLPDHQRITAATGQHVVERYGMTETLMNTSVPAKGPYKPGTVGQPLPGVDVRLVDDDGNRVEGGDGETIGEVQVRGPQLFTEYLGKPDATAAAFAGGWFRTGDMATRDADGYYRLVGRRSTDLIKSGGYKIGAGEVENALLDHPGVSEAAVTGEPDADLGERVIAWIVPADLENPVGAEELTDHVASQLAPHKRPREVRFRDTLPRNHMGKILKRELS
ncbi:acyl-CoA synthetase [Streptomyces alkaliterrae]|uniref:AMP-binding protein n=1 Tax=Streptomyces alkaliterrae TaxID=2213162 RepID=A0A5P0YVW1_9ACTN|nr:acyl-CoA synthetase [Streptomyces alkaliterrae]MBB1260739.1 acyl-CoA synthetase [Streptomyces alkaliterrae]MQS02609.1 AMP-binding protein [Streptomyces alkaliterrae]